MKKIFLSVIALEMVVNKAKLMDRFTKTTLSLLALMLSKIVKLFEILFHIDI